MRVTVQFHAQAVDLVGARDTALQMDENATCGDVKRALVARHPELEGLAPISALASEREYLADGARIHGQSALHFIPPVSGG